jgi:hypothetical protein
MNRDSERRGRFLTQLRGVPINLADDLWILANVIRLQPDDSRVLAGCPSDNS